MTIEQAVAILEAERVLQDIRCGGPDIQDEAGWLGLVREAGRTIQREPFAWKEFKDLALLNECPCDFGGGCDSATGPCKCRD